MKKIYMVFYKPYKNDIDFLTAFVSAFDRGEIKEKLIKNNKLFIVGENSGKILKIYEIKDFSVLD